MQSLDFLITWQRNLYGLGVASRGEGVRVCFLPPTTTTTTPTAATTMSASASTSTPRSQQLQSRPSLTNSLKRKLQVYVEIPPSLLHSNSSARKLNPLAGHKSGTPLSSKALNYNSIQDSSETPLKKFKVSTDVAKPVDKPSWNTPNKNSGASTTKEASERFPNGYFHCHQCRTYRDIDCKLFVLSVFSATRLPSDRVGGMLS